MEKTFLVINLSCFGDVLLTNSLCQNLKISYPNSKVIFCVDKPFEEVAKYQKDVDEVMVFDKRGKQKGLINLVKYAFHSKYRNKIDASFVIYGNKRGLLLSKFLGAKQIVTGAIKRTWLINTPQPKCYSVENRQISNEYLAEVLTGKESQNLPIKFEIKGDTPVDVQIDKENSIALCLEANNPEKDLPMDIATELIQKLNEDKKTLYLLGSGESASDYANNLRLNDCSFIDLTNKTNFSQLAKVLTIVKGLISIDTGTMHMSTAVKCPVLGIFLKENTSNMWAPIKTLYKSDIIETDITAENIINKFYKLVDINE